MRRRALLAAVLAAGLTVVPGAGVWGTAHQRAATGDQKVLWVWAHPDDETIAAGLALRQHLEAGRDCYVLILTRGSKSGVRDQLNGIGISSAWGVPHDPVAEGYAPLDEATFGAARIAETLAALKVIASGTGRTITVFEGGLQDSQVAKDDVMAAIEAIYDQICTSGESLWIKTHTDLIPAGGTFLENVDHTAAAQACRQLAIDQPTRFGNLRMYVEPEHWNDPVVVAKHLFSTKPVIGSHQPTVILNAYLAFKAWAPDVGRYAIGWQSVPGLWITPPENRYHT